MRQHKFIFKKAGVSKSYQIVKDPARNNQNSYYTQLTNQQIKENPQKFTKPNWFQINVHFDIATHNDYLILKYGDCKENDKVPIVRIHSESLLNRFPLAEHQYQDRYKRSLDLIIRNGCGIILIFYNDGRGSGFGYYVLNTRQNYLKAKSQIGVQADKRDYFGAIKLIKHYINPDNLIDVLIGQSSFKNLSKEFSKHQVKVRKYIRLSNQSEMQGIHSIEQRIRSTQDSVEAMLSSLNAQNLQKACRKIKYFLKSNKKIYTTGIGTSQAQSKALEEIFKGQVKYITPLSLNSLNSQDLLVVFSQNLSPNIMCCLDDLIFENLILITAIDQNEHILNSKKSSFIQILKQRKTIFLSYPKQVPDDTLVRITGPILGFCMIYLLKENVETSKIDTEILKRDTKISKRKTELSKRQEDIKKSLLVFKNKFISISKGISNVSDNFIQSLVKNKNLLICCDGESQNLIINIRLKMIQGSMINTHITNYIDFGHGLYQFIQNEKNYSIWFITKQSNKLHQKAIQMLNEGQNSNVHVSFYEDDSYLPLQLQMQANHCLLQLIQILNINQIQWPGKNRQHILYDVAQ